jgi:hypothetical protein
MSIVPEPITAEPLEGMEALTAFVRAIDRIQQHTPVQLRVPNLNEITDGEAREIVAAALLLEGHQHVEQVAQYEGNYDKEYANMHEGVPQDVTWTCPMSVDVGPARVDLGVQRRFAHAVSISLSQRKDGRVHFVMRPAEGSAFLMRRVRA